MALKQIKGGWQIDYRDDRGNRFRKTYRLKKDAESKLAEIRSQKDKGEFVSPRLARQTFKSVAEDWFANKRNYRPSSLAFWRTHLDLHLLPALGELRLDQVTTKRLEEFRNERHGKKLSAQTVNKLLTTARAVFEYARKHRLVTQNPAADVDRIREDSGEITEADTGRRSGETQVREEDVLNPAEIRRLIEATDAGLYRALIMAAALTGCRHDELLALRWADVDFNGAELYVRRSLSWARLPGEELRPRFFQPKTKKGLRKIPLAPVLAHELKTWKLRCPPSEEGLVFPNADGTPMHRGDVLRYGLYPALTRAKLRRVDMHSLRHSFASTLIADGTPLTEVQHLMGHSSPSTTLEVYLHWLPTTKTGAVDSLAKKILGGHFMDTENRDAAASVA